MTEEASALDVSRYSASVEKLLELLSHGSGASFLHSYDGISQTCCGDTCSEAGGVLSVIIGLVVSAHLLGCRCFAERIDCAAELSFGEMNVHVIRAGSPFAAALCFRKQVNTSSESVWKPCL